MAASPVETRRRLVTVDEYDQMVQAGVFPPDDRLELIEGEIIKMSPIGSVHAAFVIRLNRLLGTLAGAHALIGVQSPIHLPRSEPQPDALLLRPRADDYEGALPEAADVLLAIEVSDTTAHFDRTVKIPLYGRAGIPAAWLIDVEARLLEAYHGPSAGGYREKRTYGPEETVAVPGVPGASLNLRDLFVTSSQ